MQNLIEKIDELVPEGNKNRHTFFQLQAFVIGQEPTIQAKIQGCKRELLARKDSIQSLVISIEEAYDQQKLHELDLEEYKNKDDARSKIIAKQLVRKVNFTTRQVLDLRNRLKSFEEEANFLIGLLKQLSEIEKPKDWDSLEVQTEFWNAKLSKEVNTSLMIGQPPDKEVLKAIFALPEGAPIKQLMQKMMIENRTKNEKSIASINKEACQTESQV